MAGIAQIESYRPMMPGVNGAIAPGIRFIDETVTHCQPMDFGRWLSFFCHGGFYNVNVVSAPSLESA